MATSKRDSHSEHFNNPNETNCLAHPTHRIVGEAKGVTWFHPGLKLTDADAASLLNDRQIVFEAHEKTKLVEHQVNGKSSVPCVYEPGHVIAAIVMTEPVNEGELSEEEAAVIGRLQEWGIAESVTMIGDLKFDPENLRLFNG